MAGRRWSSRSGCCTAWASPARCKELGLPRSEFVTALLTFNVGVEAGQLAVIGAAFLLVGWHCAQSRRGTAAASSFPRRR